MTALNKIKIGISSCLLGEKVRYDGGHKRDHYITDTLAKYFEFIPFCPEMAIGLGTPRSKILLFGLGKSPRAIIEDTDNRDVTDILASYGRDIGQSRKDISGYIFKSKSPSCGMEGVNVHNKNGHPFAKSAGVYANAIIQSQPLLPMEEEHQLNDPVLRDSFMKRVFAYYQWQNLIQNGISATNFKSFHRTIKFLIIPANKFVMEQLNLLASNLKNDLQQVANRYIEIFMISLKQQASLQTHIEILQYIAGYLVDALDIRDQTELNTTIEEYFNDKIPIIVPLKLIYFQLLKNPEFCSIIENKLIQKDKDTNLR